MPTSQRKVPLRLPTVSLSAEHLVIGQLMRRNVVAFKAPPNAAGYDLICVHPDPTRSSKALRVQVKSRFQTDCNRAFLLHETSIGSFDFMVAVFLNVDYFYEKEGQPGGRQQPEYFVYAKSVVASGFNASPSGLGKLNATSLMLPKFKNDRGFEQIAKRLRVPYPKRTAATPSEA